MELTINNIVNTSSNASSLYEKTNTRLKIEYLKRNVNKIHEVFKNSKGYKGAFATGYPFDVLDSDFKGELPVIEEQLRYNEELKSHAENIGNQLWCCTKCLEANYENMPDLKQICKPCPKIISELKPRKIINRLPDLDMWILCSEYDINSVARQLSEMFEDANMRTSDINPLSTIRDVQIISSDLEKNIMPEIYLPLDVHIISEEVVGNLLAKVNEELINSYKNKTSPYLPIHPLSYRKTWQKDDVAYNFIFDYLSSLTLLESSDLINYVLETSRKITAENFDYYQLYELLLRSCGDAHKRRYENKGLQSSFERKLTRWKN